MSGLHVDGRELLVIAVCAAIGTAATVGIEYPLLAQSDSISARALRLQREAIVFDTHVDTVRPMERPGWRFSDRHAPAEGRADLPKLREGGVTAAFFAVGGDNDAIQPPQVIEDTLRELDTLRSTAERYPNDVALCLTAEDVRRAKAAGKLAMLISVEGGHTINDSLAVLREYERLGARSLTLTHFASPSWADSATQPAGRNGLTPFGKEVVREMNRLGMIVDVSHASDKTFYDALQTSEAPIFASHSSVRALSDHPRNMSDEMMKALAAKGGLIQITFHEGYLDAGYTKAQQALQSEVGAFRQSLEVKYPGPEHAIKRADEVRAFQSARLPKIPWIRIVDHIDYAVKIVGADHVGLGSDFDSAPMPEGVEDPSGLPKVTEELLRRGYREADVKKILGGNVMKLLEEVEATSRRLRAQAVATR